MLCHLERGRVAKVTIQHQIGQWEAVADAPQQREDQRLDARQLRREFQSSFGGAGAAFWTARLAFGSRRGGRLDVFGLCGRFFLGTAQHLLEGDGKGMPLVDADKCEREERQARNGFAIQTGKEAIQAWGVFAGFGDNRFIPSEQIDISGVQKVGAKEQPKQCGPGQRGGKKALDRPIAAALPCPA